MAVFPSPIILQVVTRGEKVTADRSAQSLLPSGGDSLQTSSTGTHPGIFSNLKRNNASLHRHRLEFGVIPGTKASKKNSKKNPGKRRRSKKNSKKNPGKRRRSKKNSKKNPGKRRRSKKNSKMNPGKRRRSKKN
jgi:hypothetical protein